MQHPKNIVITGGNNGVGYQVVKSLYQQGHNIIFGARNKTKNQQVIITLTQKQGGTLLSYPLDLSIKKSVQQFAKFVLQKFTIIDCLNNNAGLSMNQKQNNQQGIQMTLAINHFGHFYLTFLLWNAITASKQSRVINVSSDVHYWAQNNYLQDIQCQNKKFGSFSQYNISKLYNVLFTQGLKNLIIKNNLTNIKTCSLHPGVVQTGFGQTIPLMRCVKCLCCCIFVKQQQGAISTLHLFRIPFQQLKNGQYHDERGRIKQMDPRGRNIHDIQQLWKISQETYGISFK